MTDLSSIVLLFLGAYALHSTLFFVAVWLFERLWKRATPALLSALWRTALLAGIATATLQASGIINPIAGRFAIALGEPSEIVLSQPADIPPPARSPGIISDVAPAESGHPAETLATPDPDSGPNFGFGLPQLDIGAILLALWAGFVFLLALRAAAMWWAARCELSDRQPVVQGPLFERIQALAQDIGLRRLPQVSFSDRIAGPFTLPNGEICIPVWAREELPQHQLDAMLAHEMAHVLHRDSLWLAIGMGVGAVFFFQPLNLIVRKRLAHLAELTADDWAATRAGSGRPLAECISTFVDIAHAKAAARAAPEFAAAMAKPESELVQRVERLLNDKYTSGVLPMKSRLLIGAGALALAMVMPGLAAQAHETQPASEAEPVSEAAPAAEPASAAEPAPEPDPALEPGPAPAAEPAPEVEPARELEPAPEPEPQRNVSIHQENGGEVRMNISITKPFSFRLTAWADGEIKLAPDGSGVTHLSDGGVLDATLDKGGQVRRVRYTKDGGQIRREFWVGGQSRAWGVDADRFVAELMPIIFRETGISANERVDWLLKERGADALLAEIELIDSDSITSRYMLRYLETNTIPAPTLERLLAMAGRRIDSDSQLQATLSKAYDTQKPAGRQLIQLLKAGQSIDSDSQTAALLHQLAPLALDAEDTAAAYFDLARSIDSDSQMTSVLLPLVSSPSLSEERIIRAIRLAGEDVDSDSQLAAVLHQAAPRVGSSDAMAKSYLDAARSIQSDSQCTSALLALGAAARLTPESWRGLLDAAAEIGSDSQKASLLIAIASRFPREPGLVEAYRSAAKSINSDSQRRGAERALN